MLEGLGIVGEEWKVETSFGISVESPWLFVRYCVGGLLDRPTEVHTLWKDRPKEGAGTRNQLRIGGTRNNIRRKMVGRLGGYNGLGDWRSRIHSSLH